MGKNDRFERIYSQGTMNVTEIWVDIMICLVLS